MRRLLAAAGLLAALAFAGPGAAAPPPPCAPSALTGALVHVAGSEAAGSVSYRLRLRNAGQAACAVSGRPGLRLLDRRGHRLPTHVVADRPGTGTAALITLLPGQAAVATARFTPDVPAPGEHQHGACEHPAHRVRIALASPGRGALAGPVKPPTPVCQHGRIALSLLSAAR